jgi:LPXTG-motif cell wall-anchored protein
MQDSNPKTDIVCGDSAVNWSYYRKVPASITEAATNARMHSHPSLTTLADTSPAFSVPQPNAPTNKKSGTSKAWIAGAVIGPLLGLALIGAIIFFVLRRRKNKKNIAPQQGGTAMMAVNTAQAPPGVGGYTDAKPQFTQQQQPTYTAPQQQQPTYIAPQQQPAYNDPYANQGAYAAQQGYNDAPLSPAPQYNTGAGPYNPPVSPPPQDVKHGYVGATMGGAAELGGPSGGISPVPQAGPAHQAGPVPYAGPSYHAAELGGEARQGAGPSELATNSNSRPTA